jgi:predicted nucleotidyltransferase
METWTPRDGDTIVTKDKLIFYVFGYEHPKGRVFSFLKYIPSDLKSHFQLRFLKKHWTLGDIELLRPEKLYTAENFQIFMETFRKHLPHYVYFCPFRGKEIVSVPLKLIETVYVPNECLKTLVGKKRKDRLQRQAVELTSLLSDESGVPFEDFGIHGSVALNMHTVESDIDLVVYGSYNFRNLEKTVERLVDENTVTYIFNKRLDRVRKHRGRYKGQRFVYNAVRKTKEIVSKYGDHKYSPVKPVTFSCQVTDDNEAMFRPAIYQITDYQPLDSASKLAENEKPTKAVSMIGCYRNMVRRGERARVSGLLERIENVENGENSYQVVVGTGTREDEHIWSFEKK